MPNVPADRVPAAATSGETPSSNTPLEHEATANDLAELIGKDLRLTKFVFANKVQMLPGTGQPPGPGRIVTLQLTDEGHVAGQGPVNRYFGELQLAGGGQCSWAGPLGSTRMAGPPEANELETNFLSILGGATHLIRSGEGLRFETADKSGAVEFHPAE
jgi:heat shock protein HslJ